MRGIIKTFDTRKGFGFISVDGGGDDYFFHLSAILNPDTYHGDSGLPVDFEATKDTRTGKNRAEQVQILDITQALPEGCRFDSFLSEDGHLNPELFFEAPKRMAKVLSTARVNPGQLRLLLQRFSAFAQPLKDGKLNFFDAREKFGVFYIESLVRQVERKLLPLILKSLIDAHREIAFSDPEQMLGLYRYLQNIVCYFPERESRKERGSKPRQRGEAENTELDSENENVETPEGDTPMAENPEIPDAPTGENT